MRYIILIVTIIILSILLFRQCESEPKVITKVETKIKTKIIRDTIEKVVIGKPKKVYIKVYDTIYKKETVYLKDSLQVNRYPLSLLSNKASFEGFALTSGKLYDFDGIITYPQTTITKEVDKIIETNKSALFGYIQSNTALNMFGLGVDYQIKNKVIIGANVTHHTILQNTNINLKLGIKL